MTDARKDPVHASSPATETLGVIAYAGVPLTNRAGRIIGSLCAIDQRPRIWTATQLALLANLATLANAELHLREAAVTATSASARAEHLIATMPVGYIAYDFDWRVIGANAEAARIVDSTVGALVGNVLWELFPATVGSEFDTIYRRVLATGVTEVFEYFYPDPLNKWYEIRVQSDAAGLSVFFVDITARRDVEARNEKILATMPVGFIMMDEAWTMTAVNAVGAELAGSTVEELVGRDHWEVFPQLAGSELEQTYRRVAATGEPEVVEVFYPDPLNAWYDVRVTADDGEVSPYFTDVSVRHRVQELVEEQARHDRTVATALQQALLSDVPDVVGLVIACRYLTATGDEQVGGDWYDAVVQPDGSLMASIGDVSGHDIAAAGVMGQLRAMLRGFTWDDTGPVSRNLTRLDLATRGLQSSARATVIAARVEPPAADGSRVLHWSNAGHPCPIVLDSAGTVVVLETPPEVMIGVLPGVARLDHTRTLPPGSTVVFHTDGLIETRDRTQTEGLGRLVDSLRRHTSLSAGDLLDAVLADLGAEDREDDIALLAIRTAPASQP